ncbi:MAG TPA: cell division protein CrgA [Acidimicrobiales bacterium]|nr:cell division protein CrgA [Acidimicrobiales bacterium]
MASTPKQRKGKSVGRYSAPECGGRYTAPRPPESNHSPLWYPWMLIDLLLFGLIVITLNYLSVLPGAVSSWYLVLGLVAMFAAFFLATRYR